MSMYKIKGVLAVVLVVGLGLGGIGRGVGPSTNPVVGAEMQGDQSLDGLWEDIENDGGWLRFEGSTIKYHPAGANGETDIIKWTCRYNLTPTPMTIDIFQRDDTAQGIFVIERGTLFIAFGEQGEERPTRFKRDKATTLLVLRRVGPNADQGKGEKVKDEAKATPFLVSPAVLESVDAKKGVITAALGENEPTRVLRLLALEITGKKPAPAEDKVFDNAFKFVYAFNKPPRLVDVLVRSDAKITSGKDAVKLKDLQPGQIVSLQLATNPTEGFVVVGIRVANEKELFPLQERKKP